MKITSILACLCLLFVISCKDAPDRPEPMLDEEAVPVTTTTSSTVPPPPPAATTNTNSSVPHYKCPNNCAGSGGASQGTCPVCGTAYVHNPEFHNQGNSTPAANPTTPGTPPASPPITAEPAQNAAGVWHYTCPNGCAGGGGSAIACASCGTTLTHNKEYHN